MVTLMTWFPSFAGDKALSDMRMLRREREKERSAVFPLDEVICHIHRELIALLEAMYNQSF